LRSDCILGHEDRFALRTRTRGRRDRVSARVRRLKDRRNDGRWENVGVSNVDVVVINVFLSVR
jgi:hypothetical protein